MGQDKYQEAYYIDIAIEKFAEAVRRGGAEADEIQELLAIEFPDDDRTAAQPD